MKILTCEIAPFRCAAPIDKVTVESELVYANEMSVLDNFWVRLSPQADKDAQSTGFYSNKSAHACWSFLRIRAQYLTVCMLFPLSSSLFCLRRASLLLSARVFPRQLPARTRHSDPLARQMVSGRASLETQQEWPIVRSQSKVIEI